jgi:ABC-type microcin C transport system permease subunit YejE
MDAITGRDCFSSAIETVFSSAIETVFSSAIETVFSSAIETVFSSAIETVFSSANILMIVMIVTYQTQSSFLYTYYFIHT